MKPQIDGFVLVGGASSRMGRSKADLIVGGIRLYERSADALAGICGRNVSLVGEIKTDEHPAFTLIPDGSDHTKAAIFGLAAALRTTSAEWAVVVACDLPFVSRELFQTLASIREAAADAVVPIQKDGTPQPLCALYRRESCLGAAERMIGQGELRLQRLLDAVKTIRVPFARLAELPGSENFFFNVNTPEDLASAERIATT